MSSLEALLLGIVQGLTEFLPISSSGHLILVPWLQDYRFLLDHPEFNKTFDVALHAGTLIAAIVLLPGRGRRAHRRASSRAVRKRAVETTSERLSIAIAIGTVPAVIFGGLGSDFIDRHLGEPWMIAIQLIFFALLLGLADSLPQRRSLDDAGNRDGIWIGAGPGPRPRSGHVALGDHDHRRPLPRPRPRQRGAVLLPDADPGGRRRHVYKGAKVISDGLPHGVAGPMIVGTIGAAVSGFLAIAFLLRLLRTSSYRPFVYYRLWSGWR